MKKVLILLIVLAAMLVSACGNGQGAKQGESNESEEKVVVSEEQLYSYDTTFCSEKVRALKSAINDMEDTLETAKNVLNDNNIKLVEAPESERAGLEERIEGLEKEVRELESGINDYSTELIKVDKDCDALDKGDKNICAAFKKEAEALLQEANNEVQDAQKAVTVVEEAMKSEK